MPLVTRACIEEIKNRVNIYDVVAPHVALKRIGSKWRGLSPFNAEKTPSFYLDPEKNFYYCFSSSQGGDIFRFVQAIENLSFNEAIESIALRFSIPLQYEKGAATHETTSTRKELFDIHEWATQLFRRTYQGDSEAAQALRNYWVRERQFTDALAETFSIGLAPVDERALIGGLLKENFSAKALYECGLFYTPKRKTDPSLLRPRFRGRLMIPIRDVQGRVIAFTGRQTAFTPKEDITYDAKYVNSPETSIFVKSRVLFGLDQARKEVSPTNPFILVEGQIDAMRCWQKGLKTAIAPQGTAITSDQLSCIRRYTDKIECLFDGDAAGQKAALRLLPLALKADLEVHFSVLPPGEDPDSFLIQNERAPLEELRTHKRSAIAFALQSLLPSDPPPSAQDKSRALAQLYEIIDQTNSVVARDEYRKEAAEILNCNPESLMADFQKNPSTHQWPLISAPERDPVSTQAKTPLNPSISEKKAVERLTTAEYELLWILIHFEDIAHSIAQVFNNEWIVDSSPCGKLLKRILAEFKEDLWEGTNHMEHLLETEEEKNLLYATLGKEIPIEEPIEKANEILKHLFKSHVKEQKSQIELRIKNTLPEDFDKRQQLQKEIIALRKLDPPQISTNQ